MLCEMEGFINGQQFKRVYEKQCEPLMKKYNLKKIELDVLFFLYSYQDYDTAKDIVNQRCLSKAHVSKAIETLTARGYVVTQMNGSDRRCVHLAVTAEAKPVVTELYALWNDLEACIYRDVSSEEQELFQAIMNKIVGNINAILGGK